MVEKDREKRFKEGHEKWFKEKKYRESLECYICHSKLVLEGIKIEFFVNHCHYERHNKITICMECLDKFKHIINLPRITGIRIM